MEQNDFMEVDPEVQMLSLNKESGYTYRERRQPDWTENYTLYRDKVIINRLTQRQSVNLPLMKQTIRTILKDVDDMPVLHFENLGNDKQKEVFCNEYWKWTLDKNKMELKDIVDKRQMLLFGRTFDQMQIVDGMVKWNIVATDDILVDRYIDPTDIDTARSFIHTHIFVPLSELERNEDYDQDAIADLKIWFASEHGIIKSATNEEMLIEKNKKMEDMGLTDANDPVLGETYVELSMHFVMMAEEDDEDEQYYLFVEAEDMKILMKKKLEEVIGTTKDHYWRNHLPYNTWADDVEVQDFWSDSVADIVRTPNKVLNTWFSQLVENRTLRSFGMHYYNSSIEGFEPNTFNPVPWGWYGVPVGEGGRMSDVFQKVDVPDLSESIDEMSYVEGMIEKATGATSTKQGVQTENRITLGEVELALGEATDRIKGMSKFYTPAWKMRGEKFLKLIEASPDKLDAVKIYKKGRNSDDIYEREITPNDWKEEAGYKTQVWSQDEKNAKDSQELEKINIAVANIPGNPKLIEVYQRKLLEFAGIAPDDTNDIIQFEKDKMEAIQNGIMTGEVVPGQQQQAQPQVAQPQV